jgi:hypothetical protein
LLSTWIGRALVLQGGQVELQDHGQQVVMEDRELHGGMKRPRAKQVVEQGGAEVSSLYPPIHSNQAGFLQVPRVLVKFQKNLLIQQREARLAYDPYLPQEMENVPT